MRKLLFKIHQWLGTVMSLLFVMWFLSGIVMIFQSFPKASPEKNFLAQLEFGEAEFQLLQALPDSLDGGWTLERIGKQMVYRKTNGRQNPVIYDAQTLQAIREFDRETCREIAGNYGRAQTKSFVKLQELTQWMPWKYYESLLPIYQFDLDDQAETQVFVSAKSGQVVQETNQTTRFLAYIGAIPHWLYFKHLRLQAAIWSQLVIWLSGIGVLVSLSGIIVGFIRLRKRRQWLKNGGSRITPYRNFWFRWHHLTGFFFGLFVFTFILSGLLSMVSFPNSPSTSIQADQAWRNLSSNNPSFSTDWEQLQLLLHEHGPLKSIQGGSVLGKPVWLLFADNQSQATIYEIENGKAKRQKIIRRRDLLKQAQELFPEEELQLTTRNEFDNYYQPQEGAGHPLPVYRLNLLRSDTQLYIDRHTGKLLAFYNSAKRWHRWLYQGLHTFNLKLLIRHQFVRISLLILCSLGGLAVSFTGLILGVKWLFPKTRDPGKRKQPLL